MTLAKILQLSLAEAVISDCSVHDLKVVATQKNHNGIAYHSQTGPPGRIGNEGREFKPHTSFPNSSLGRKIMKYL